MGDSYERHSGLLSIHFRGHILVPYWDIYVSDRVCQANLARLISEPRRLLRRALPIPTPVHGHRSRHRHRRPER